MHKNTNMMDWGRFDIEITKFSCENMEEAGVHASIIECVCKYGLPSWCSPHLYFGEFDGVYFQKLSEWSWHPDWGNSYDNALLISNSCMVLGIAQDNNPIVIMKNDPAIYIFTPDGNGLEVMNMNIGEMLNSIYAYSEMVESATASSSDAFVKNEIPNNLIQLFISKVTSLQSRAISNTWKEWAMQKGINA